MTAESNERIPHFIIVGHPNKGKSTIVSTLAHDESVEIGPTPGTTQACQSYPMSIGNKTLYVLVDTPGFQRPRRVLEYLKSKTPLITERSSKITELLNETQSAHLFPDEIEILSSIMYPKSGVIYVVDGSVPYSSEYEPEMEILQWSGQPRMALINPIHGISFVAEWEKALRNYFGIVKVFNPIISPFSARVELLKAFGQLDSSWADSLVSAQAALLSHRTKQDEQAATSIVESLMGVIRAQVSLPIQENSIDTEIQSQLSTLLERKVKEIEDSCWKQINKIFLHSKLLILKDEMSVLKSDIFSKESIHLFGLSKTQLAFLGFISGGTVGAILDLAVGGASFLIGSGLGAGIGAVAAHLSAHHLLKFRRVPLPLGSLDIGSHKMIATPSNNMNIAFIFLKRAITYYLIISERSHGNRTSIVYAEIDAPKYDDVTLRTLRNLFDRSRAGFIDEDAYGEIIKITLQIMRSPQSKKL